MSLPTRTYPDFGATPSTLISPDIDGAEIAARLSLVSSMRRSGRVVYYDRFDNNIEWRQHLSAVDNTIAHVGIQSMKMSPAAGDNASIERIFPPVFTHKYGIEFYAAFGTGIDLFNIILIRFTPTDLYSAGVSLDFSTGNVYIESASMGGWVLIGSFIKDNVFNPGGTPIWQNFKLVADFSTNLYSRLMINDTEIPSTLDLWHTAGAYTYSYIMVQMYAQDAAGTAKAYIDNVILTIDEP